MVRTKIVGVLVVLSLALGCGGQRTSEGPGEEKLVLRSYAAGGRAAQMEDSIRHALRLGERRVGSVGASPDGSLLVLAPASVHEGLAELFEAQALEGEAARPASVAVTYWLVAAQSAAEAAERVGGLTEIEPVLDEIVGAQGPQDFRLIERLALRQAEGVFSEASTPRVKINQKVTTSHGGFQAWIDVNPTGPTKISTTVHLRADQFLVLGQLALDRGLDPFFWPEGPPRGTKAHAWSNRPAETFLYVILRAETDDAS